MSRDGTNEQLKAIEAELARQDEEWNQIHATLMSLGDVKLAVPQTFLDEIEELARPRGHFNDNNAVPFGIRG